MQLPFLCKKSEGIVPVPPGLTAGWLSDNLAGWLASR